MGRIDSGAPLLESIGVVVSKRRIELGLSQEELATRCGVHRTYISDVERGVRNVSILTLARIASGLDIPLGVLFFFTGVTSGAERSSPR